MWGGQGGGATGPYPAAGGGGGPGQQGQPQANPGQQYHPQGPPTAGLNPNNKYKDSIRPPRWGPERAHSYPFKRWTEDLAIWCLQTPIEEHRWGIFVFFELEGLAQEKVRDMMGQYGQHFLQATRRDTNLVHPETQAPTSALQLIVYELKLVYGHDQNMLNLQYCRISFTYVGMDVKVWTHFDEI